MQAKNLYIKAKSLLDNDAKVNDKISYLDILINKKYDEYMTKAHIFLKADNGEQEALYQLNKALSLKPNDSTALGMKNEIIK